MDWRGYLLVAGMVSFPGIAWGLAYLLWRSRVQRMLKVCGPVLPAVAWGLALVSMGSFLANPSGSGMLVGVIFGPLIAILLTESYRRAPALDAADPNLPPASRPALGAPPIEQEMRGAVPPRERETVAAPRAPERRG